MTKHDSVNHPKHYTSSPAKCSACGHPIECIDITEHMGFNLGNATKYTWRCDLKADAIEDLEKAAWYLNREIQKRKRTAAKGLKHTEQDHPWRCNYCRADAPTEHKPYCPFAVIEAERRKKECGK